MSSTSNLETCGRGDRPTKIVWLIASSTMALTPLALVTDVFLSHDVIPKVLLLTSGAALLLFLFPIWAPLLNALWSRSKGRYFLILVIAQCLSLLSATFFSGQISLSLAGTVWRRFGLIEQMAVLVVATAITCLAVGRSGRGGYLEALFRPVAVCGGLAAIYGILQYFGIDPFLERKLYTLEYFGGIARPPATMGHALYFSAYLAPVLLIAVSSAFNDPVRRWRQVHALAAILCTVAIVLSATRSAMAGALSGAILFGWRTSGGRLRALPWQYVTVVAAVIMAVPVFVLSPAGVNLRSRILQWNRDFGGSRFPMWLECPALIAQHPFFGEGPDRFAGEFRKMQSVELSRRYPEFYHETPHNAFIDVACAQGIPGVIILAAVFLLPWLRRRDCAPDAKALAIDAIRIGLEAATLAVLICSMFASFTLVESLYLWSIAGLSTALYTEPGRKEPRQSFRPARIPAVMGGAMLLAAGTVLAIQDCSWAAFGRAVAQRDFRAAQKDWSTATLISFGLPGYELWGSRGLATLALASGDSSDGAEAWKLAVASAALAETRSEEPAAAAFQSALSGIATGELSSAELKARKTILLAPNWYRGHLLLSQILQMTGKTEESAREAVLAGGLGARP